MYRVQSHKVLVTFTNQLIDIENDGLTIQNNATGEQLK